MSNPRPESRIKSLETRASTIEASIEELSADQAESNKALFQHVQLGFKQAHTYMQEEIETRLDRIEATMATKDDITELKKLIMQLFEQRTGE